MLVHSDLRPTPAHHRHHDQKRSQNHTRNKPSTSCAGEREAAQRLERATCFHARGDGWLGIVAHAPPHSAFRRAELPPPKSISAHGPSQHTHLLPNADDLHVCSAKTRLFIQVQLIGANHLCTTINGELGRQWAFWYQRGTFILDDGAGTRRSGARWRRRAGSFSWRWWRSTGSVCWRWRWLHVELPITGLNRRGTRRENYQGSKTNHSDGKTQPDSARCESLHVHAVPPVGLDKRQLEREGWLRGLYFSSKSAPAQAEAPWVTVRNLVKLQPVGRVTSKPVWNSCNMGQPCQLTD